MKNTPKIILNRIGLFALLLWLAPFGRQGLLFAQTQVQVTINVMPPYSAYLQDYAGVGQQIQVIVRNTTLAALDVRLQARVEGDNGVLIQTLPNFRPNRPLKLMPGETRILTRADLEGSFDLSQISVEGLDKNLLYQGKPLPEGNYQLCVQAFDNRTSQPLSSGFPLGCSPPFSVRTIEPPILISPLCDTDLTPTTPQATVFTWTPPAGILPTQVSYTLRVIELPLENVNPNVFIDAVALPPSGIEVKNLPTSAFLYGPQYLPLKVGKRYAWRVQAVDKFGKLNLLNDGKSPVCAFRYGQGALDTLGTFSTDGLVFLSPGRCDKPTANTLSAGNGNDLLLVWKMEDGLRKSFIKAFNIDTTKSPTLLSGLKKSAAAYKIRISQKGKTILERQQQLAFLQLPFDNTFPLKFDNTYDISVTLVGLTDLEKATWKLPPGTSLSQQCTFRLLRTDKKVVDQTIIAGTLKFRYPGDAPIYPLPNTRVRLQFVPGFPAPVGQAVGGQPSPVSPVSGSNVGSVNKAEISKPGGSPPSKAGIYLGKSVLTDYKGEYQFTVDSYREQLGMAPADTVPPAGSFRLVVDNPYVDQPAELLIIPLQKEAQLADQIVLARSYRLTVNARKTFDKKNWPLIEDRNLDNQVVILYRKPKPNTGFSDLLPIEGMADRTAILLPGKGLNAGVSATGGLPGGAGISFQPVAAGTGGPVVNASNGNNTGSELLTGFITPEPDPIYGVLPFIPNPEEEAKKDLAKAKYAFIASGTLKLQNNKASVQISRLLYSVDSKDTYYIYCPNAGQTMQGATAVKFNAQPTQVMNVQTPAEETYDFDINTNEAPRATFTGRMLYQFADPDEKGKVKPLANTQVRLVLTYVIGGGKIDNTVVSGFHTIGVDNASYQDNLKTIATAVTDAQGNFSFDAALEKPYSLGLIDPAYISVTGPTEFKQTTSGPLYRTFRVVVDNPYYASPAADYGVDGGKAAKPFGTYSLGDLTAVAQSYSLQVQAVSDKTEGQNNGAGQGLTGVDIYVLRKEKPVSKGKLNWIPPSEEGQNIGQSITNKAGKTYWLVAKGRTVTDSVTGKVGVVTFKKLIRDDGVPNIDDYILAGISNITSLNATLDKISDFNDDGPVESIAGVIDLGSGQKPPALVGSPARPLFANDYEYTTFSSRKQFKPALPRITIRAIDATQPQRGIAGVSVRLVFRVGGNPVVLPDLETFLTDTAGYFTWQAGSGYYVKLGQLIKANKGMTDVKLKIGGKDGYYILDEAKNSKPYVHYDLKNMALGANYYNEKVLLHPNGTITGRLVLENKPNYGIDGYVQVGRKGPIVQSDNDGYFVGLQAPSNTTDSLYVYPNNKLYFEEQLTLKPFKDFFGQSQVKLSNMGDIPIYERDHRIRFRVAGMAGLPTASQLPASVYATAVLPNLIPNASIDVFGDKFAAGADGYVNVRFKNMSLSNLSMTVSAPGHISQTIALPKNEESRTYTTIADVVLKPAKAVTGIVLLNKGGNVLTPLGGAEVFVSSGKGAGSLTTQSGFDGKFTLLVPADLAKPTVQVTYADKSGMTYEGMTAEAEPGKPLTLTVKTFSKFKIATLYGFPVKLTKLVDQGNTVKASGEVVLPQYVFRSIDPTVKLTFSDLLVGPDPKDPQQGIPMGGSIPLGLAALQTGYYGGGGSQTVPDYNVKLTRTGEATTLAITPRAGGSDGWVRAKAQVVDNSFKFPSSLLSYESGQFHLFDPTDKEYKEGTPPVITAFVPSGTSGVLRTGYGLSKADGTPLSFRLLDFPATSKLAGSRLMGSEIWIAPDIQATIPNAQPAKFTVSVDKIVLRNSTIDEQTGKEPLTVPLSDKWKLSVSNWKLDYKQGGFYAQNTGKIVTGKVDIPIKTFNLRNDLFVMDVDKSKLANLSLANIATMQVTGPASCAYDTRTGTDQAGHWSLVFTPGADGHAATISKANLPGLTDDLVFETFSLLDNGEDILSFAPSVKPVKLYSLVDFLPRSIETGPNYFAVGGSLNTNIPRVSKDMTAQMRYTKAGGNVALNLTMPTPVQFEAPGYVTFKNTKFSDNKNNKGTASQQPLPEIYLTDKLMVMRGTVEEPGELAPINVLLINTPTATRIVHEVSYSGLSELAAVAGQGDALKLNDALKPIPQKIPIVGDDKYFDQVQCGMRVVGNDWEKLRFSGLVAGVLGIEPKRLEFTVHGEIVANDQEVGVKGANLGNGTKFSLVYDRNKHHITGTANLPGFPMDGGMTFKGGAAQFRIGTAGFYVATSGQVDNVPVIVPVTVKTGMMVGYYDNRDLGDAQDIVFMFAHQKKFPCAFKDNFKGYFMIGEVPVPVIGDYHQKVEFGLGSAEIGVDAYVDSYFYGQYSGLSLSLTDAPNLSVAFGGGTSANVRAYAKASVLGGLLKVGGEVGLSETNGQNYAVDGHTLTVGVSGGASGDLSAWGSLYNPFGDNFKESFSIGFCLNMAATFTIPDYAKPTKLPGISPSIGFKLSKCIPGCQN